MSRKIISARIIRSADQSLTVLLDDNDFEANIGEVVSIQGTVTVVDQDGNILCEQPLTATQTAITGGALFLNSVYDNLAQSSVNTNVVLTTSPVVFATGTPGVYQIAITGDACGELIPNPVTVEGTLTIATSTVISYPGQVPMQPLYANGFFNFEFANGGQAQITFGGITNNMSETADYGFLQIVTSSVRSAVLADGSTQFLANFNVNALDDHNDNVMSPVLLGIVPGSAPFNLTLSDAPGFQIVDFWNLGSNVVMINQYTINDNYSAFLMSKSEEDGAQWVPVAQVNWAVSGTLNRNPNPPTGTPKWTPGQAQVTQPNLGVVPAFPQQPAWSGIAQGKVLAQVVQVTVNGFTVDVYQTSTEPTLIRRNESVRY
jgi:hypothetical protein